MKKLISLGLTVALVGCGMEIPKESQENSTESSKEGKKGLKSVEAENYTENNTENNHWDHSDDRSVTINSETNVSGCQAIKKQVLYTETVGEARDPERFRFNAKLMTWEEAMTSAPRGFHLASRVELLDAYDAGEFDWVEDVLRVWTSTEAKYNNQEARMVGLVNGNSYSVEKTANFNAIYARD